MQIKCKPTGGRGACTVSARLDVDRLVGRVGTEELDQLGEAAVALFGSADGVFVDAMVEPLRNRSAENKAGVAFFCGGLFLRPGAATHRTAHARTHTCRPLT
jgi:hypothetical protein